MEVAKSKHAKVKKIKTRQNHKIKTCQMKARHKINGIKYQTCRKNVIESKQVQINQIVNCENQKNQKLKKINKKKENVQNT